MSDTSTQPATGTTAIVDHGRRNTLVIGLLLVSAFVVILNETILSVALPALMGDLDITATAAQWLTTGFMLTMAVVIPITGFVLQRFNTRPVFITAMSLFSLGTLISALAPGFGILLFGRIVQATGTAIMMPLLMTTVLTLVDPAKRGRVMGNISIVISVAPAIGPTVSGLILSVFPWRGMFLIVLPIAIAALILGAVRMRNVTEPRVVPIDMASVVISIFAFGGLVYGLTSLGEGTGIDWLPSWLPLVVGILFMVIFITRQLALQKSDRALLDLRTFTSHTFTVATVMMGISMMAMFGTLILLPLFLTYSLGIETLQIGLLLLPGGLLMGVLAPFVGRMYDRVGPRPLLVPGAIILSTVFWALTLVDENTPVTFILIGHIVMSVGLALLFTPLFSAGLGSLRPNLYSHGSATVGTVQQLAGAAGTALFITVMSVESERLAAGGADLAASTAGGVHVAFMYGAVISLFGIVAAFFVKRPVVAEGAPAPVGH